MISPPLFVLILVAILLLLAVSYKWLSRDCNVLLAVLWILGVTISIVIVGGLFYGVFWIGGGMGL